MSRALFLVVALLACVFARTELESQTKFIDFIKKFGKSYSHEDFRRRYEIFKDNLNRIDESNRKAKHATFGVTQFSDLSIEEFRSTILMKNPIISTPKRTVGVLETKLPQESLPTSLDWRSKGAVTPVKNQGQCGSCWAFSVTENIESMWILGGHAKNTTLKLSPQQIVDCDNSDGGCNGGNPPTAYDYVIGAGGLESESAYPYTAQDGNCNFNNKDVQAKISSWKYASSWHSESELQNNLVGWGPLSICVDAANWQNYQSGVMTWEECAWINILDHCVELVGYNQDASVPYWIVRNSWGTSWGENGYILLSMGSNTCGLANEATSSVVA